ncbi:MAG: hypothetical protein RMJ56_11070 [Gemmataceae bacterium]|nr:hypothetical protein [Gemmata sp.]MDW8198131.1 hypothetical protein [Gemmataceae bacterium]
MTLRYNFSFLLALIVGFFSTSPALAAESSAPALLANYWDGFIKHWTGVFQQQNGIVMGTLVVGAICLFIITRGKWRK